MADLTSKVISNNFQRLLQIDSGVVQDGTGSAFALRVSGSNHIGINADPRTGTTLNVGGDITATSGSNQVIFQAGDGSLEITRSTGDAYIDFKTSTGDISHSCIN